MALPTVTKPETRPTICAKQHLSRPCSATLCSVTMEYDTATVWIDLLAGASIHPAGICLCSSCLDGFRVPLGWTLVDRRLSGSEATAGGTDGDPSMAEAAKPVRRPKVRRAGARSKSGRSRTAKSAGPARSSRSTEAGESSPAVVDESLSGEARSEAPGSGSPLLEELPLFELDPDTRSGARARGLFEDKAPQGDATVELTEPPLGPARHL